MTDAIPSGSASGVDGTPAVPEHGMVLAVMGAKGGCGATLVATNLAAALARDRRTCLVDLDLSKGDVAGFLDLESERSINLVLDHVTGLDDALLRGAVDVHSSGLHVLTQPYDLTDLHHVSADEARTLLMQVRGAYEVVVVDLGSNIDPASLSAALLADEILLVSTPDVPAVRDTMRVLRLLRRLQVPESHLRLAINKHGHGLPDAEIAAQLGIPVAASLSRDDEASQKADTFGKLVREVAPRSSLAEDLEQLWAHLHGQRKKRSSRMPWWWAEP